MSQLKVAHVVNYAPGLSGMYGTVRDLYFAERAVGLNAQIIDDSNTKKYFGGEYGVDGVFPAPMEFAESADIICWHHAMVDDWFNEPHRNIVMFLHGTPEFNLHTELYKSDRVLSLTIGCAAHNVAREFVTMWKRHVPIWETVLNRKVQYVPAWVDYASFKSSPRKPDPGVIRIGMLDYWRLTREPFGLFMAIDYLRKNGDKKVEVDVWGLTEWPDRTWQAALQWMYEDDIIVFKGNTMEPMKDIYHKVDVVLTASSEETRVVREGFACGVPVVCGHADMPFTNYSEDMVNTKKLAEAIDLAHTDLCKGRTKVRRHLRRYAKTNFDVRRAALKMADVFENVVKKHGSVNHPVYVLPSGERQVHSVDETANTIRDRLEAGQPTIYTRFGDGQLLLMGGHEGWDYWHHADEGLKKRLLDSFTYQDDGYLVGCSAGQENEGKMRNGLFARHQVDDELRKIARDLRPEGTYHNAIALTYKSVFDVEWFCDFLNTCVRPKASALVCNELVAQSELVKTVLQPDEIITIPRVDAYKDIDRIMGEVRSAAFTKGLIMSAAGPISNVIAHWIATEGEGLPSFLDIGSIADGLAGIQSHGWIRMVGELYVDNYCARYNEDAPVDIIIPTYGRPDMTEQCFTALQTSGAKNYRVIWVDNGSRKEELDALMPLADKFDNCEHMHFDTAVGFSKAVNAGLKRSLETGDARYVLLLNNDVIVTPGFLQRMINALEKGKHGAVGPLTSENNPQSLEALGAAIEGLPQFNGEAPDERAEVLWEQYGTDTLPVGNMISFFCCLMRRRAVHKVGPLDENLFAYGEDNDYCNRMLRAGYTIGVAAGSYVHHHHHATTEKLFRPGWRKEQQAKARRYLEKKYAGADHTTPVGPFWEVEEQ
jgi:GT2 family glycosyltransferase/glycosyltransferase involved in cell wall biosynthesis